MELLHSTAATWFDLVRCRLRPRFPKWLALTKGVLTIRVSCRHIPSLGPTRLTAITIAIPMFLRGGTNSKFIAILGWPMTTPVGRPMHPSYELFRVIPLTFLISTSQASLPVTSDSYGMVTASHYQLVILGLRFPQPRLLGLPAIPIAIILCANWSKTGRKYY